MAKAYSDPMYLYLLATDEDPEVMLNVAKNRSTLSRALTILARKGNDKIKAAVASHKNTDKSDLYILARISNEEIKRNIIPNHGCTICVVS